MYNRIVLAVDGSENSLRATKETVKLVSLSPGCHIEVISVVDFSKSRSEILHAQGKEELELKRRRKLASIEEILKQGKVEYTLKFLHGEPGPTIIDFANKEKVDMVIIGSRGLNALQEMVLGSVSHKVVKRVNCPVMVVK